MATDIEQGIYAILSNNEDVKFWASSRVYVGNAPQDVAVPYVTFRRAGGQHVQSAAGLSGLAMATIVVQGWTSNYADSKALAKAIRLAMVNGAPDTVGGVKIATIIMQSETDIQQGVVDGEEVGEFAVEADFDVWHSEDKT